MPSLHQRLCEALTLLGSKPCGTMGKLTAYTLYPGCALSPTSDGKPNRFLVGPSGALRFGHSVTSSLSLTDEPLYQKLLAAAKPQAAKPQAAQPLPATTEPRALHPTVPVTVALSANGIIATTPAGTEVALYPDIRGMQQLRALLEWQQRLQAGHHTQLPPLVTHPATYDPRDFQRVCHCGAEVKPFMERCPGCPGQDGAGKVPVEPHVKRYNSRGKRQVTLEELFEDVE